jgi:glutamine synthetase
MDKSILEYIWINNDLKIMSKIRILNEKYIKYINQIPDWNYNDLSLYGTFNIEFIIKPCFFCNNYLTKYNNYNSYLVLCDTYDAHNNPLLSNKRNISNRILNLINENKMNYDSEPWVGFKNKYYFISQELSFINLKKIVEEHLEACLFADINIFGITFDSTLNQYIFKIGPCRCINACDQLLIVRYLLGKISEKYNIIISHDLKLYINFSTNNTREENGINVIEEYIKKLNQETFDIRIPIKTLKYRQGHFNCNVLSPNINPYIIVSYIYKTCCLD